MDDCFVWIENELQLLETRTDFKAKKAYEEVDSECVKDKYASILNIFVSNLFQKRSREVREFLTKDRIVLKIRQLPFKYRKALDLVIQSGAGRSNSRYFLRYLQRNMEKIEMSQ